MLLLFYYELLSHEAGGSSPPTPISGSLERKLLGGTFARRAKPLRAGSAWRPRFPSP